MARNTVFPFVEGDEQATLNFTWQGQDLSDFSVIELHILYENGKTNIIPATIDDSPNGKWHFEFGTGDLPRGLHSSEVYLEDNSAKPDRLFKDTVIHLNVRPKLL